MPLLLIYYVQGSYLSRSKIRKDFLQIKGSVDIVTGSNVRISMRRAENSMQLIYDQPLEVFIAGKNRMPKEHEV